MKKYAAVVIALLLVLNLVFLAIGKISELLFWTIIAICAILTYRFFKK